MLWSRNYVQKIAGIITIILLHLSSMYIAIFNIDLMISRQIFYQLLKGMVCVVKGSAKVCYKWIIYRGALHSVFQLQH